MSKEHQLLTESEIEKILGHHPDWRLSEGSLVHDFEFNSFNQAFAFVARVALLAEKINHHPKIVLDYRKVQLILWSFDVDGVSLDDLELLKAIELMVS